MRRDRAFRLAVPALCLGTLALAGGFAPTWAETVELNFNDLSPGRVVAGDLPGGGTAASGTFAYVNFSVENYGGGPNSLVVFNTSAPTGGDIDLGSPNQSFGGPGVGAGGAEGQPGENSEPLGNVLIIGEGIEDATPTDGLVDDPDDEAGGGLITADFELPVQMDYLTLLDMDASAEGSWIKLYQDDTLIYQYDVQNLGDNSVQQVDLTAYDGVTKVVIYLRGSGAIDNFQFRINPMAVDATTWGGLKSAFRQS